MLQIAPNLTDQVYDALVDEICDGRLAPGRHLVQERLAERFGVSRQPIQQTMSRLKADGMVEEIGRRGLFVTRIDPARMLDNYGVRAALDGWAAKTAALRVSGNAELRDRVDAEGRALLEAAATAISAQDVAGLVKLDYAFHSQFYAASGNRLIVETAEPHWRFLRRAMGDVLRKAENPVEIWRQHRAILEAIVAGDATAAMELAEAHARDAALLLADALMRTEPEDRA
ncbi:MAG TPA: GntR family transcriptional regulator [Thermohalobaculum sp.]|nr:GntR family transcriptional regulator [Thermohalobaculum sp.]